MVPNGYQKEYLSIFVTCPIFGLMVLNSLEYKEKSQNI